MTSLEAIFAAVATLAITLLGAVGLKKAEQRRRESMRPQALPATDPASGVDATGSFRFQMSHVEKLTLDHLAHLSAAAAEQQADRARAGIVREQTARMAERVEEIAAHNDAGRRETFRRLDKQDRKLEEICTRLRDLEQALHPRRT